MRGLEGTLRLALAGVALGAALGSFRAIPARAQTATFSGPFGIPAQSSFDPLDNGEPLQVRTLSGRADLVSGGDALIEVGVPVGTTLSQVKVRVGERDVTGVFRPGGPACAA